MLSSDNLRAELYDLEDELLCLEADERTGEDRTTEIDGICCQITDICVFLGE